MNEHMERQINGPVAATACPQRASKIRYEWRKHGLGCDSHRFPSLRLPDQHR